jgi:ligand-binding sensor domain-containing protein
VLSKLFLILIITVALERFLIVFYCAVNNIYRNNSCSFLNDMYLKNITFSFYKREIITTTIKKHFVLTKKNFFILFLFSLIAFVIGSKCMLASESIFKNYSVTDGLVTKSVTGIIQDKEGFIWVATTNGISRFDGYEFKNFSSFENDSLNIHGTFVFDITEGDDGRIWLLTDVGLEYYEKNSETFHLLIEGNMFKRRMGIAHDGTIWLTDTTYNFISYKQKGDSLMKQTLNIPFPKQDNVWIQNFELHNNALWIACNKGIARYNLSNNELIWVEKSDHVFCSNMHVVDSSTIIMTFDNEGICTINTSTLNTSWVTKSFIELQIGMKTTLFDAVMEKDCTLCISVSPGIVFLKDSIVKYYNSSSTKYYFEGKSFASLYLDKNDNIWVGTIENGIFLKKKTDTNFKLASELYKNDLQKTQIASFHVFDDNSLLYTDNKNIYRCKDYNNLMIIRILT